MKKFIFSLLASVTLCAFANEEAPDIQEGWRSLRKDDAKAEKIFRANIAAAQDDSERFAATLGLMYSLRYQNKNAQVVKEIDTWLSEHQEATNNQIAKLCAFKGNALRDTGKIDEALATYKKGFDAKSEDASSLDCAKEYMWVSANNNKTDLTWAMYEASCQLPQAQNHAVYLVYGGWCMWKINKAEEGLKMLEAAEKISEMLPVHKEALYRNRGYIQRYLTKEYEAAVKTFEAALPHCTTDIQKAVIWNNIGGTLESAQEYEKALEAYKKATAFNVKGWIATSAANSVKRMQQKVDAGE